MQKAISYQLKCKKPNSGCGKRDEILVNTIVLLSGIAFLIYEVSWIRMLSLVLGATVSATTVVLMSYMAGFGAGAWFWGRIPDRSIGTWTLLGLLSGMTGILGLASRSLIPALSKLYTAMPDNSSESAVFVLSCAILFLPAFCMGGILPAGVKLAVTGEARLAEGIGRIYSMNALGSAIGGLLSCFFLLRVLGLSGTILAAVCINLAIAAVSFFLPRLKASQNKTGDCAPAPAPGAASVDAAVDAAGRSREKLSALLAVFVFGFIGLIQQVVWIRVLKVYLPNTSYTFSLIASLVIAGLAIGSWVYRSVGNRIGNHAGAMVVILGAAAVLNLAGVAVIIAAPALIILPLHAVLVSPLYKIIIPPLLSSLLVVLPPSMASGFAFPLACRLYAGGISHLSREFGMVLMVNTLGCVAGPAVAAFVLIPMLGVGVSLLLAALILFSTALVLAVYASSAGRNRVSIVLLATSVCALAVIMLKGPEIRVLPPSFSRTEREILFHKETVDATIVVCSDRSSGIAGRMTYVNNSAVIGSGYDAIKAVKMIGHLPFYAGLKCRNALVVGFGIGVTASTIASYAEVERIDCVELVPGLKESAHWYSELNHDVIRDRRLCFYPGDGRHFLQRSSKKYDLISSDPTHPVLGSGDLYSREYFALCRDHLNPGGMVSQYLPLHSLRTEDFLGIIKTFYSVFPEATVWLGHSHAILLGSLKPMRLDFEEWKARIAAGPEDPLFYRDPYYLASSLIFGGRFLEKIRPDIMINTDDRSYLEFFAYQTLDPNCFFSNADYLRKNRARTEDIFFNIDDPLKMARYFRGSDLFIECLISYQRGSKQEALAALRRAMQINPENKEFPFLSRYYFAENINAE